jgi:carboxymethylenebutenolidase
MSTHEEPFEIGSPDGVIDGVLCRPADTARRPAVLFLTDIGGLRPSQIDRGKRLAAEGYVVCLPNVCYRTRRPPLFDFPRNMKDERSKQRFVELTTPLTPEAAARDAQVYVDWLSARRDVAPQAMAVVGHCFSGPFALRIAAARPDRIAAAASFHGGGLATEAATSPHLLLPQVRARLYFGHAVKDGSMPVEAIARLDRALEAWGGQYESETYEGAFHGWTASDGPVFNAEQAERAFETLTHLLRETLGQ